MNILFTFWILIQAELWFFYTKNLCIEYTWKSHVGFVDIIHFFLLVCIKNGLHCFLLCSPKKREDVYSLFYFYGLFVRIGRRGLRDMGFRFVSALFQYCLKSVIMRSRRLQWQCFWYIQNSINGEREYPCHIDRFVVFYNTVVLTHR